MSQRYKILYSPEVKEYLQVLSGIIFDAVERQLAYQPTVETRNRKPMRPNPVAPWELRVGNLRVYYDGEEENQIVLILAVGVKRRNRLYIGERGDQAVRVVELKDATAP